MEVIGGWLREVLLPGVGTVLFAAAFGLVRRYASRLEDERLRQLLLELVRAAEQIYGPGRGEAKRDYVIAKLREHGYTDVDRAKIEAMVFEVDGR